jgi:hypothetical protein
MPAGRTQRLSSWSTPIAKFLFPVIWVAGWSAGTYGVFRSNPPPQGPGIWALPLGGVLGTGFVFWYCSRLRKVTLDGDTLIVSDYRREVRVPLARVSGVKRRTWISPPEIIVTFDCDTGLGEKAIFIPSYRFWNSTWWQVYET